MPNKKIIYELKRALKERGSLTREQRQYAMDEEKAMMRLYPLTRPCDEKRFSHLRTLKSYIGESAFRRLTQSRENNEAIRLTRFSEN